MKSLIKRTTSNTDDDGRRSLILGVPMLVGLMLACIATIGLYKLNIPEHVDRDTISITFSEYEQALGRWRSRNVAEYRMTIAAGADLITLRVVPATNEVYLLQHLRADEPTGSPNPTTPTQDSLYHNLTVDALFASARAKLDLVASGSRIQPSIDDTDFFHDYIIKFDPNLAYPAYFEELVRSSHRTREIVWREQVGPTLQVKELTLTK